MNQLASFRNRESLVIVPVILSPGYSFTWGPVI